jgi:hypothetical protein
LAGEEILICKFFMAKVGAEIRSANMRVAASDIDPDDHRIRIIIFFNTINIDTDSLVLAHTDYVVP